MSAKKNKSTKKPAVGTSAAGSNNKIENNLSDKGVSGNNSSKIVQTQNYPSPERKKTNGKILSAERKIKKPSNSAAKNTVSENQNDSAGKKRTFKQSFEEFKKNYNMGKIAVAAVFLIALLAGIIVSIVLLVNKNYSVPDYVKTAEYKGLTEPESVAFDMDISLNQQKALVKATRVKGKKNKFSFFINDEIKMSEYNDPALIEFGSIDSNDCVLVLFIFDKNGKELYRSLGVEQGREIRSVNFFEDIPYGTHEITAAVIGYDSESYEKIGMQTSKIKLKIGVD